MMIRIDVSANRGAGIPLSKAIALAADIYALTLFNMGIELRANLAVR
ncbi:MULTISPECIES: hypothetical protein [Vibrio]|nr:hypothetical protein [Vibrio tasmaniensis]